MYKFLNFFGECFLPDREQIVLEALKGSVFLIHVDSSILLDLIAIVNKNNLPQSNLDKAIQFIEYQNTYNIDASAILTISELTLDKETKTYNIEKFNDYANKFLFALSLSKEQIIKKNYDYHENWMIQNHDLSSDDLDFRVKICDRSYVVLLKIREIAIRNGVNRGTALTNIEELLKWMKYDLRLMMAIELQLAIYIFGGINTFNEMIWLKKDNSKTLKKIWGTAMDISFFRVIQMMESFKNDIGVNDISILATKDERQFKLLQNIQTLFAIKNFHNNPFLPQVELSISGTYFEKYENSFKQVSEKYSNKVEVKTLAFSEDKLLSETKKLEIINEQLSY